MSSAVYGPIDTDDDEQQRPRRFRSRVWQAQRCLAQFCHKYRLQPQTSTWICLGLLAGIAVWLWLPSQNRIANIRGPMSREEIGHMTWSLLHTMAAKIPQNFTSDQQDDYVQLLHIISRRFPCEECAGHFRRLLKRLPPDVSSADAFRLWLCTAHNVVRERLQQAPFDCKRLETEWPAALRNEDGCACGPKT